MSDINMSEISDTRSIILQAAIDLFVDNNYDGVSIRQIAQRANCNMSAISYHFGGKEKLYEACFDSLDLDRFNNILSLLDGANNSQEFNTKLKLYIVTMGQFAIDNKKVFCLYAKEHYSKTPIIKGLQAKFSIRAYDKRHQFFAQAIGKGIVRSDINSSFMARLIQNIIKNEFVFGPYTTESDLKIISEEFINLCNRSIYEH